MRTSGRAWSLHICELLQRMFYMRQNGTERIGPDAKRLRSVPDTNVLLPAKTVSVNKPASVEAQSSKRKGDSSRLISLHCTFNSMQNFVTDLSIVCTEIFTLKTTLCKWNRFRCERRRCSRNNDNYYIFNLFPYCQPLLKFFFDSTIRVFQERVLSWSTHLTNDKDKAHISVGVADGGASL